MPDSPTWLGVVEVTLETPPAARIAPDDVFDAYGWCESDVLVLRRPPAPSAEGGRGSRGEPCEPWARGDEDVSADNPPGMAFVFREACDFLPKELARLHAFGLGLTDEWALAPYAIDDATDVLHARRARPRDWLWLAADRPAALAWGLHDWAHFHNHGPFTQRAWTELQCDATALAWLWRNRRAAGLAEERWERTRRGFERISARRFADEGLAFDARLLEADRVRGMLG